MRNLSENKWQRTALEGTGESGSPEVSGLNGIKLVKLNELEIKMLVRNKLPGHTMVVYHPYIIICKGNRKINDSRVMITLELSI